MFEIGPAVFVKTSTKSKKSTYHILFSKLVQFDSKWPKINNNGIKLANKIFWRKHKHLREIINKIKQLVVLRSSLKKRVVTIILCKYSKQSFSSKRPLAKKIQIVKIHNNNTRTNEFYFLLQKNCRRNATEKYIKNSRNGAVLKNKLSINVFQFYNYVSTISRNDTIVYYL